MAKKGGKKSGIAHAETLANLARLHYINGHSYQKIIDDPQFADMFPDLLSELQTQEDSSAQPEESSRTMGKPSTATIARLIEEAETKGVISFSVDSSCALYGFADTTLSSRLMDAFDLSDAIVIDPSVNRNEPDYNRNLQRILANQAASIIGPSIGPNEHIAVAGGQTVMHAVKSLSRRLPYKRRVKVTSLCGRLWSNPDFEKKVILPDDADDAAFILAWAFGEELQPQLRRVSLPLYTDASQAKAIMDKFCEYKYDGEWREDPPSRCIVGVGSLTDEGHRFWEILDPKAEISQISHLRDFAKSLNEAVKIVKKERLPLMGDITNRLFPVLPLPQTLSKLQVIDNPERLTKHYEAQTEKLADINAKRVGINWKHLRKAKVPTITLIAGGEAKREAMFSLLLNTLLSPATRIVNQIITDKDTANALISAKGDFNRATDKVQNWYEQVVTVCFAR